MDWLFVSRREYRRVLAERNDVDRCFVLAQAKLKHFERFKLFLKTVGDIDVDFAWDETAEK